MAELRAVPPKNSIRAALMLECLDEITRLQETVFPAQQTQIDRLLIERDQLKEALSHYRNNPPPHPAQSLDAVGTDGCKATTSTLLP